MLEHKIFNNKHCISLQYYGTYQKSVTCKANLSHNERYLVLILHAFFIFYVPQESQKSRKVHLFFLKTGSHFSTLFYFFFSLNNTKKKLYINAPEMFIYNSKTSI